MKLCDSNLNNSFWQEKSYSLPTYDRDKVRRDTIAKPTWLHLGAGNIFRAFLAQVQQEMLESGRDNKGIIVAEGFDYEIIDKAYKRFDNLCVSVVLKADGKIKKSVLGSVVESLKMDIDSEDWKRLKAIFTAPSLQMVSFTITEKGYVLKDVHMNYFPAVVTDFENGPDRPVTYLGKVTALCYERFLAGELPVALVSMDNCSQNGERLLSAVREYAENWEKRCLVKPGFYTYITDSGKVTFPWTAIDKITPRPDAGVEQTLIHDGLEDVKSAVTSKRTFVAPFVNAEETQYLVIEDNFPNGHPVLQGEGIYFTSRATVDKFEKMKVCTCLNPLHTALAIFGCLLNYRLISDEMKDKELCSLVTKIAYQESMPVVINPGIIDPMEFTNKVLTIRFPNPFNPDTPQRIATDTSQKLPIRFGETIKAYEKNPNLKTTDLKLIPLVLAGWCRFLMGVNDDGEAFNISSDPMLGEIQPFLKDIRLGDDRDFGEELRPILSNAKIFGTDLYKVGLGKLVESYFRRFVSGKGAVRKTLIEVVD